MTHSHLLKVFSYLGLRGSRKSAGNHSIIPFPSLLPVIPHAQLQSVDIPSTLWQLRRFSTRRKGDFRSPLLILASRGSCCQMGQANSFVRGYGGVDEGSKGRIDQGSKGSQTRERSTKVNDSPIVSHDVDGSLESQVEQKASANVFAKDDEAERVLEAAVPLADAKLEKELVSECKEKNQPEEAPNVMKEVNEAEEAPDVKKEVVLIEGTVEAQTALNLALDELGEPPERPLAGDCCGQGCEVCVWDTYNDELRDYLARKKELLKKSKKPSLEGLPRRETLRARACQR